LKLAQIYELAVKKGIEQDPRGEKAIQKILDKVKKDYEELKPQQKQDFDKEAFTNPYADTRILNGNPDKNIKSILIGIDMEVAELLLADRLSQTGKPIDLVVSHHPEGNALAAFYQVMHLQTDVAAGLGVPISIAESLLDERIKEVERRVHPANHTRAVDAAKLLGIAFMCIHTPADNHAFWFIRRLMEREKPRRVQDIVDILMDIDEYKIAAKGLSGPRIILGSPRRSVGKILVEMTGGTEGSRDVFDKLYKAGVRTLVSMHLSEEHFKKSKDANLNVVIAGHISSDTLGLNLLLDRIEKEAKETFQTIDCSGFNRIKRSNSPR